MPQHSAAAAGWIGHVVAGHRLDAIVGEGGMGVVFRATHLRLGRTVALKVLPPPLAADHEYRRRFEREAAIAASLEHPNVVPIYDAGHVNGVLYLSMRFVQGEDLDAVLRREGRLGVDRVCAVLGPIADALDAVHEAGLVHRDVKPGNILIARTGRPRDDGHVYLCDFGIAKGPAAGGPELTSAGAFLGTVQYCSPEQIEGRWLDGRSDQYGLACLAYRCLTGEVPYPRPDTSAVIYAHLGAAPPRPSLLLPGLPPAVDAAIARAAAKHPDHRFPNCAAFIAALRAAGASGPSPRSAAPAPGAERVPSRTLVDPPPAPGRRLPRTLPLPEPVDVEGPTRRTGPEEQPAAPPPAPAPKAGAEPAGAPDPAPVPDPTPAPASAAASKADRKRARQPVAAPVPVPAPAPKPDTESAPGPGSAADAAPVPVDVRAERTPGDPSITITWTAGGAQEVEYKVTRLAPDGRWQVVGRTRSTSIVDGAVAPDADIPTYAVVAKAGSAVSAEVRTPDPAPDFPAVQHLRLSGTGALEFEWPPGITEAMVVVRPDRPPATPTDPAATAWKITNMRYQLDGGLRLPDSVARPCHVAVASCRRDGGTLVVSPVFDPTAHTAVGA